MGHKGSGKFSGAQGQVVKVDDVEIEKTLRADQVSPVKEKAAAHRETAVQTLADCMNAEDASWPAKCTAARDILAYSDGRPHSATPDAGGGQGITINILRLSDGTKEEIHINAPAAQDVVDITPEPVPLGAVDRARELLGGDVE